MVAECTWLELVLQVGTLKEVLNDLATIMTRMYQFFAFGDHDVTVQVAAQAGILEARLRLP
jgi:hypothetical protein